VLLPRGYRAQKGQFCLQVAGGVTQQLYLREICLWLLEPQPWWDGAPGLMPLYPLCRHRRPRRHALVHAARTIADQVSDTIIRADLLTTLYLFGKLAYPHVNVLSIIGREQMRESKAFQEIREEGMVDAKHADISEAIALRFGDDAVAEFRDILLGIRDLDELSRLHRLAIQSRRIADLRRAFAPHANHQR
jgi:hypothetical protein